MTRHFRSIVLWPALLVLAGGAAPATRPAAAGAAAIRFLRTMHYVGMPADALGAERCLLLDPAAMGDDRDPLTGQLVRRVPGFASPTTPLNVDRLRTVLGRYPDDVTVIANGEGAEALYRFHPDQSAERNTAAVGRWVELFKAIRSIKPRARLGWDSLPCYDTGEVWKIADPKAYWREAARLSEDIRERVLPLLDVLAAQVYYNDFTSGDHQKNMLGAPFDGPRHLRWGWWTRFHETTEILRAYGKPFVLIFFSGYGPESPPELRNKPLPSAVIEECLWYAERYGVEDVLMWGTVESGRPLAVSKDGYKVFQWDDNADWVAPFKARAKK